MILEPPKIKSDTVSTVSPSISHEVMGPDAMIFVRGKHCSFPLGYLLVNARDARDVGLIPGLGRSPGGGHATHSSILA